MSWGWGRHVDGDGDYVALRAGPLSVYRWRGGGLDVEVLGRVTSLDRLRLPRRCRLCGDAYLGSAGLAAVCGRCVTDHFRPWTARSTRETRWMW